MISCDFDELVMKYSYFKHRNAMQSVIEGAPRGALSWLTLIADHTSIKGFPAQEAMGTKFVGGLRGDRLICRINALRRRREFTYRRICT